MERWIIKINNRGVRPIVGPDRVRPDVHQAIYSAWFDAIQTNNVCKTIVTDSDFSDYAASA
jgi:hypothetical protein